MLVAGHLQFISFVQFTWFAMERHGEWDANIPDGARLGNLDTLSFDFEFFSLTDGYVECLVGCIGAARMFSGDRVRIARLKSYIGQETTISLHRTKNKK